MKISDPNIISKPKPEPKWKPCTLRDDPLWQGHFDAILNGLYAANFRLDWDALPEREVLHERMATLATLAYVGACQAHCTAFISDHPNPEVEVKHFNEIISEGAGE